jgi:hypothetical protein
MSSDRTCGHCGTLLAPEARFCRHCGRAASQLGPDIVTESTTRLLETPAQPPFSTFGVEERAGEVYRPPEYVPPAVSFDTRGLERPGAGRPFLLAAVCIALLVALVAVAAVLRRHSRAVTHPPAVTAPGIAPPAVPAPPGVPAPPAPPATGAASSSLAYPGAKVVMQITNAGGTGILQLETQDSVDQVATWYEARLKPDKVVRERGGKNVVLDSADAKVIISGTDNVTNIFVKQ